MKLPKYFFKLSISEQESFLVEKLRDTYKQEDEIKRMLADVRSGYKFESKEIDRPDLLLMKTDE